MLVVGVPYLLFFNAYRTITMQQGYATPAEALATAGENIDAVQQIGSGLLASAGVAGVIVGFAAQKSLATIIAGLQVALSSPMKIGDVIEIQPVASARRLAIRISPVR